MVIWTDLLEQGVYGIVKDDFMIVALLVFTYFLHKFVQKTEKFRLVAGTVLVET